MCNTYGDKNILLVGQIKESNVKIPVCILLMQWAAVLLGNRESTD